MAESSPAHIDGLPIEVLSLIFTTVVGASLYARSTGDKSYGLIERPTLLASICTHWRRVAISTPTLWSHIDFTRNSDSFGNLKHARLYVERSQDSPVHVHLGKSSDKSGRRPKYPIRKVSESVLSLLRTVAPHVRSCVINFSNSQGATEVLSIFLSRVAEHPLSELALGFEPSLIGWRQQPLILGEHWDQLFRSLNALYLDHLPINPRYLSCRNLVELQVTSPYPTASDDSTVVQIRQLLNNNPNLRTVKLGGSDLHIPTSIGTQSIHLPALCRLDLAYINDTFVNWLLTSLVSGSHELELYLDCALLHHIDELTLRNTVIAFFQRTPIKSLHISGRSVLLRPILAHLPHLRCLSLSAYDFDHDSLDGIEDLASTLVNLRTVELNECDVWGYSELDRGLKTLLTFPSVRQIRYFLWVDGLTPGALERFRKLLEEDQDITAQVVETPELADEMRPSPFR